MWPGAAQARAVAERYRDRQVVGMGLTFLGQPELGIPLMEASTAVGESDALGAAMLGGPMLLFF